MTFWVKQTTQWENKRNHSYHTCKFDIDWISILLKIGKSMQILISSPPAPPLPASFSRPSPPAPKEIWL